MALHLGKPVAEHFNLSVGPLDCPQQLVRNLSKRQTNVFPVRYGLRESQGAQVNEQSKFRTRLTYDRATPVSDIFKEKV